MKRIVSFIVLFSLGMCGAWWSVYSNPVPVAAVSDDIGISSVESKSTSESFVSSTDDVRLSDSEKGFRGALARGERLEDLRYAIQDEDPTSLKSLRSTFLDELPEYQTAILPQLKKWCLEELLFRFSRSDWRDWPHASAGLNGSQSRARAFVDAVLAVNQDLGVFLETAANLYHGLFRATNLGLPYSLRAGVRSITENPSEVLSLRHDDALSVRFMLSSSILLDNSFREPFERERCSLVGEYLSLHRRDTEQNVKLLGSVSSDYCTADVSAEVAPLLSTVLTNGSLRYREALLTQEMELRTLDGFARADARVKYPLASLYAETAHDLLAEGRFELARRFLGESVSLYGGDSERGDLSPMLRRFVRRPVTHRYDITADEISGDPSAGFIVLGVLCAIGLIALCLVVIAAKKKRPSAPVVPTALPEKPRAEIKEFPRAANMKRR